MQKLLLLIPLALVALVLWLPSLLPTAILAFIGWAALSAAGIAGIALFLLSAFADAMKS